jgi:hypothetical protein
VLKVQIAKPDVRVQGYTDKKGQPAKLAFQEAWLFTVDEGGKPDPYPSKVEFIPPRDEHGNTVPYGVGDYQLHPSAVYIDRNGRLAAQMRLTPLKRTA